MKRFNVPIAIPKLSPTGLTNPDSSHVIVYADNENNLQTLNSNGDTVTVSQNIKNTIRVSETALIKNMSDLTDYLDDLETNGQTDGVRVIFDSGHYAISDTVNFDYSFPIHLEGSDTYFEAATGLTGKPMFLLNGEVYFKSVTFDGTTLTDWELSDEAKIICIEADGVYCEIVDFFMYGGARGICCTGASDIFVFNFIISGCSQVGIGFASANAGGSIDAEMGNFENCAVGVNLFEGSNVDVFLNTLRFLNETGQVGINYVGADFTYSRFSISNCEYNQIGTFLNGIDFTLERDADIELIGTIGYPNKDPKVIIEVEDQTVATTCTVAGTYYKVNFGTLFSTYLTENVKFSIENISSNTNNIKYLTDHTRDILFTISVAIQANANGRNCRVGLVRDRNSNLTLQGKMLQRLVTSGQPQNMTFQVYVKDVLKNDIYSIFVSGENAGVILTIRGISITAFTH